ncbi:hypothetical protein GGI35DRAFT_488987 [Trichoderma velutinum]
MAASLVRTDGDTWALAFKIVQERESKLMLAYEEYLSSLQGENAASGDISIPEFIKSIVDRTLEDREKKRWRVSLFGIDVKVKVQVERLTKFLLWSESIVKAAKSSQPYAALAWSGVSLLLSLIVCNVNQNEAMLNGFNSIGDIQMYWRICEETYLRSLSKLSYEQHLAKLYSIIIEYQARVLCHLSKHHLSREWNDIISPDEWDKKIQEIRQIDEECRNILHIDNADQIERKWKEQLLEMQKSQIFLDEIYNTLLESGTEAHKIYEDEKATALLQALASNYEGYKDSNPQRVEGTFEWFFTDERFCNWRNSNVSSLLCVSAGPGCGKSVLSRSLIDERRLSTDATTTTTVCYFFFKDGDESRMYAHNALCAILHQIFIHDSTGSLIAEALSSHEEFGESLTQNFSELWKILLRCASSLDSGEIICVIDALDECQSNSRWTFTEELKQFYQQPIRLSPKLKFLILSRPYETFTSPFAKLSGATSYIPFDDEDRSAEISHDVNLVIDFKVNEIAQDFTEKDRRLIADRLKSMEHRTYLWLYLTLDIIKKSVSEYGRRIDAEAVLSSLPSEISEAYEKTLARSKNHDYTEALLHILLAANRPLTLTETNFALTMATAEHRFESHAALKEELCSVNNFRDDVRKLCGLFVRVDDGELSFIHETAREFLVHPQRQGEWQGRFNDMSKSHSIMSSICTSYLLLPDITRVSGIGSRMSRHPLLKYAARSWPLHYRSQGAAEASSSRKDATALCCAADVWAPIYRLTRGDDWKRWTSLALASRLDLDQVVQELLLRHTYSATSFRMPLHYASTNGNKQIVQMILDVGADVDTIGGLGTPIQVAADKGHGEIVQMLLDNGADIDSHANGSNTALCNASYNGHREIVQMLLDHGADVNILQQSITGKSALQAASTNGHKEIVQMLLDSGARVNLQGNFGGTALRVASQYGHGEVVQMLLDNGADVNILGEFIYSGTALQAAANYGHEEIVQMLLDNGADISLHGGHWGYPKVLG